MLLKIFILQKYYSLQHTNDELSYDLPLITTEIIGIIQKSILLPSGGRLINNIDRLEFINRQEDPAIINRKNSHDPTKAIWFIYFFKLIDEFLSFFVYQIFVRVMCVFYFFVTKIKVF